MQEVSNFFSTFFIPIMIFGIFIGLAVAVWVVSTRYKKIPPGMIGVFYGRKYKYKDSQGNMKERGYYVSASGGRILFPIVESFQLLPATPFQIEIVEDKIPNKENVPINIKGIATFQIGSSEDELASAAQSFMGKDEKQRNDLLRNILLGHLRSIVGTLSMSALLRERDEFNKRVVTESTDEFKRFGVNVSLVIQNVEDAEGFIEALGKQAVAEVKRDAEVKVAEAKKDQDIKVSDAQRESKIKIAENDALVAEAEKDRDIKKAQYKVQADKELAISNNALAIATVEQDKKLKVEQAGRDKAEKTAQIEVQQEEEKRIKAELQATVIQPAEAEKQRIKIEAEGKKDQAIVDADAKAQVAETEADGKAKATEKEGEANKKKLMAEGEGEGEKIKRIKEGEAAGEEALLLARAKGNAAEIKEKLLGEAEGTLKMAEALQKLDQTGKLITILEKLPVIIKVAGESGSQVMEAIFKSVAMPLGNIDSLHIMDMGGSGKGVDAVGNIVPTLVAKVFASLMGNGFDVSEILKKVGIDASAFKSVLKPVTSTSINTAEKIEENIQIKTSQVTEKNKKANTEDENN